MKTVFDLHSTPHGLRTGSCITIGNFDGVHLGHQRLIKRMVDAARDRGVRAVLLTFDPHPLHILPERTPPDQLTTLPERLELFRRAGVELAVVLPFTAELAALSPEDFCRNILLEKLHIRHLVIGHDFTLGKARAGDGNRLAFVGERLGFSMERIAPVTVGGEAVSSSRLRKLIRQGKIEEVPALMGRPYSVPGTVVQGFQRGRTLGFPTANIAPDGVLLPGAGVYAVTAALSDNCMARPEFAGVASVGHNPTFGENALTLEVNLLNFSGDIYGKTLCTSFVKRLRGEVAFPGPQALVEQIRKDVAETESLNLLGKR